MGESVRVKLLFNQRSRGARNRRGVVRALASFPATVRFMAKSADRMRSIFFPEVTGLRMYSL